MLVDLLKAGKFASEASGPEYKKGNMRAKRAGHRKQKKRLGGNFKFSGPGMSQLERLITISH